MTLTPSYVFFRWYFVGKDILNTMLNIYSMQYYNHNHNAQFHIKIDLTTARYQVIRNRNMTLRTKLLAILARS